MTDKTSDLAGLTVRALRARRRRLAEGLSDVEALLRGTVVTQRRRCGKAGCRCADGQLHGPYTYLSVPRPWGVPRILDTDLLLRGCVHARAAAEVQSAVQG